MKKNKIVLLIMWLLLFSCKSDKAIKTELFSEILNYIKKSEDYSKTTLTYNETGIYIVKFKEIDSSKYIKLFENSYYYKKGLDGFIDMNDNKVFFYNSNKNFVDVESLKSARNLSEPDENSGKVDEGFNSESWYFEITPDLKLIRIEDENFIFY